MNIKQKIKDIIELNAAQKYGRFIDPDETLIEKIEEFIKNDFIEKRNLSVDLAVMFAKTHHSGQKDKAGEDYYLHVERVGEAGVDTNTKVAGYLHDVLEDTDADADDILHFFGREIFEALNVLNKKNFKNEDDYIEAIRNNKIALIVKINDVKDNINQERLNKLPKLLRSRLEEKYKKYLLLLTK